MTTTAPQAAFALCLCSHTQRRHLDNDGLCQAVGCGCGGFRPTGSPAELVEESLPKPPPPPVRPAAPPAARPAQGPSMFDRAADSDSKVTQRLGRKAKEMVDQLRARLDAEEAERREQDRYAEQNAITLQTIKTLEQRLAAERAKLRGPAATTKERKPRRAAPPAQCPEPGCSTVTAGNAGLSAHRRFAHSSQQEPPA